MTGQTKELKPQASLPRFRNLVFWWYSKRLETEFEVRIKAQIEESLNSWLQGSEFKRGAEASVKSLWLTTPVSCSEDGKSIGWVAVGPWTDKEGVCYEHPEQNDYKKLTKNEYDWIITTKDYFRKPSRKKDGRGIPLDQLLFHALRTATVFALAKNPAYNLQEPDNPDIIPEEWFACKELVKQLLLAYPVGSSWEADYYAQANAQGVVLEAVRTKHLAEALNKTQNTQAGQEKIRVFHARDVVIALGYHAVVNAWPPNVPKDDQCKTTAFLIPPGNEGKNRKFFQCGFEEDIDLPARAILQAISASIEEKEEAHLFLLPVVLNKQSKNFPILAIGCLMPKGAVKSEGGKLVSSKDDDTRLAFALDKISRQISDCPSVSDAAGQIMEVFKQRPEAIKSYLSDIDRKALREHGPDEIFLSILADRIDMEMKPPLKGRENTSCPFRLPLESLSFDVLTAMRSLLASVGHAHLATPLVRFFQFERDLFGKGDERDHYFHTLKVFLLGRSLLGEKYKKEEVRRIWIVASLFHDVCYPVQTADKWAADRLKEIFPSGIENRPSIEKYLAEWNNRGYVTCLFDLLLRLVDYRLRQWTGGKALRFSSLATHSLLSSRNHGIVAAASLLEWTIMDKECTIPTFEQLIENGTDPKKAQASDPLVDAFDAATAVALHDPGIWRGLPTGFDLKKIYDNLKKGLETERSLNVAYVAWTLAYVDCVQEWGRNVNTSVGWVGENEENDDSTWGPKKFLSSADGTDIEIQYPRTVGIQAATLWMKAHEHTVACLKYIREYSGKRLIEIARSWKTNDKKRFHKLNKTVWALQPRIKKRPHTVTENLKSIRRMWLLLGEEKLTQKEESEIASDEVNFDTLLGQLTEELPAELKDLLQKEALKHLEIRKVVEGIKEYSSDLSTRDDSIKKLRKRMKSMYAFLQYPSEFKEIWRMTTPEGKTASLIRKVGKSLVN
jgi:hypothetical protein